MNTSKPLVSIIVPVYNVEKYIQKSIQSIINQTYKNFEIILVDDGSTDNSTSIARDMLSEANIAVQALVQKNQGQYSARNAGAVLAKGEWIMFIDSDDVIAPDTLQRMIDVIVSHEVEIVIPDFQMVPVGDEFRKPEHDEGVEILSRFELQNAFLLRDLPILAPSTLYNRDWYERNNLKFSRILYGEDQHFLWLMLLLVNKAAHLKYSCYNYLYHPGSIMTSSKFDKIAAAHTSYLELQNTYQDSENASPLVKKYLYPRYVMGIMHSAMKLCSKEEYNELSKILEARDNMKRLLTFPKLSVRGLSALYLISPYLFKLALRYIDSNANQ